MTSPIDSLHKLGQSLWYDNIQRGMLENGELAELIERGELRGMTSNPSIFNQAIARSTEYDSALTSMAWAGFTSEQILDRLIVEDIRMAADIFLPLYKRSKGGDGYVSVEVSPALAYDTEGTVAEALRLWELINRPNLMIKIPATPEGIPAVKQAIAAGLNVNVTLIFSIARYMQVMDAYLSGLEERVKESKEVDRIASVASFFVSRIDSKVEKQLEVIIKEEGPDASQAAALLGKLAVANAKLAYAQFRETFESERFARLQEKGARLQRPLWASTSTKNPAYADTLYVDELIGPHTVNTVPPQTLDAFRDHGTARPTVEKDLEDARRAFDTAERIGIAMDRVTQELENEGVKAFAEAFNQLLTTVEERRLKSVRQLGPLAEPVFERVAGLARDKATVRFWSMDPTLWTEDAEGKREIRKRMGWLNLPEKSRALLPELRFFIEDIQASGFTHALLLGMGGSSLAPEVMSFIFKAEGLKDGQWPGLDLAILDSTDPAQVAAAAHRAPGERTLYIVSSKSGGTAEMNAFLDYFWEYAQRTVGNHAAQHFIAITDPGTALDNLAQERRFRRVFYGDPKVGGRYSALTAFGLVPAALMGIDVEGLLDRAAWMERQVRPEIPVGRNPGLVLGAILGEAVLQNRDKLTLVSDDSFASFGSWLEQLIAESSGKQGRGIIPVDGEPLAAPIVYGEDRLFVYLCRQSSEHSLEQSQALENLRLAGHPVITFPLDDPYDLGAEFYRWEAATAFACSVLGVNAFDQPDVEDSKERTVKMMDAYHVYGRLDEGQMLWEGEGVRLYGDLPGVGFSPAPGEHTLNDFLNAFFQSARPQDYIALNAYLPKDENNQALMQRLRIAVRDRTHLATTVGFGPRFLHSTGQLHKGGPDTGLFLMITAEPVLDVDISQEGITFGILQRAQALGDMEALRARGRRVLRIHLSKPEALFHLVEITEQ